MKRLFNVTVPIAGHATIQVEAETEAEAIDAAINAVTFDHIEAWEALQQFNEGRVCYCPHPWNAEATLDDPDEAVPS